MNSYLEYDKKDDNFKLEYSRFEPILYEDIRSNREFIQYTNGFNKVFINEDLISNFKLDRDITAVRVGVLYQHYKYSPPGLCEEVVYSGDVRRDVLSLIEKGLFGLFYLRNEDDQYEFFSVGYTIPGYYTFAPGSALVKFSLEELDLIITILNTEGLDVTTVGRNYIVKNLTMDLFDIKVDQQ